MDRIIKSSAAATGGGQNGLTCDSAEPEDVVLICDSDDETRDRIRRSLDAAGFKTIVSAPDPADAALHCASAPPDVILYRLEANDAFDDGVAGRLRALNPDANLSILFVTSEGDRERREAMLQLGDGCIRLDRDLDELRQRVRVHTLLHRLEKQLLAERRSMEELVERRTARLNKALDLLRAAEKRLEGELSVAKNETRERIDYFAETQHELRTPLNAICGMSDAIRKEMFGALDNPKYKDYADNIYQSGQHLLSIIDGRLELSRIEAGADPLEVGPVDVSDIVHETRDMLGRIAEKSNVALEVDIEDNLPVIETDPRKLRQVLVNLVSNAIKFTPEDGRVTLSVKRNAKKGVLILVVSDTGIGMTQSTVRDAMKPYKRLSGDRRSGERGNGLGLSIVRKLVETLGATIEIQSSPGQGTSVKVELPMAAPEETSPLRAAG